MATNNGPCDEFTFNDLPCGMGGFPACKNRVNNQSRGNIYFFSHCRQPTFSYGLLCLSAKKLISKNMQLDL